MTDYNIILKYTMDSPMGLVIPFENIIRIIAETKKIPFEEELKNFNSFKDKYNNIKDMKFVFDSYQEIK